jgi:3',5'-cyclic AMP phosphodiesterase CpdA
MLPLWLYGAEPTYPISPDVYTTRQQTVTAVALPEGTPEITITAVSEYDTYGYSHWVLGPKVDQGPLLPDGSSPGTRTKVEGMLNFFTMSDIHITDKESPAQIPYPGTTSTFGNVNTSSYSPVIMSTTHVLDAAIQTINALHKQGNPSFDFGMALGDEANNTQYNELRWFIDTMDGKKISPSSGSHLGAKTIDYQEPYQTAGLDKSIPWYAVVGNHDQWWCGSLAYTDYVRKILTSNMVLDIGLTGPDTSPPFPTFDQRGFYVGVIDGATPYGDIIKSGKDYTMPQPLVVADRNRRSLTTDTSTTLNWMKEFFNTTSKPKGHGFTQDNLHNDFASYTFEPKSSMPIKIIVLDDTCKTNPYGNYMAHAYARGCLDQERYQWLVNELELGQAQGKLMIIAAHVPVGPQLNVPDAPPPTPPLTNSTVIPIFLSTCNDGSPTGVPCPEGVPIANNDPVPPYSVVSDAMLLQTLHNYSNVILWLSGHRHLNTVTPQPAPAGMGPEFGFWEVETPSLRDFPQQFRTFQIQRNAENTLSMFVTNVDPAVEATSPAGKSRGYAIGANRISAGSLTDTAPHVFNGELIKPLAAPYTMTVNVIGPGTVTMGPYQAATCSSNTPCNGSYLPGTQIALTPVPSPGAAFAGWSACPGTSTCTIDMNDNMAVTARFTSSPTLSVTPGYRDFGNVKTGKRAVASFTVKNNATKGIADLTIGSIAITGANGQFNLVAGKDNCSGKTIPPGKTCNFQVAFTPTGPNSKSATISLPSNDVLSPTTVQIWGAGK